MSKYNTLTRYLLKNSESIITLTFDEIEDILGFILPPSSRKYAVLWNDGHGGPLSKSWIKAGYKTKLDFKNSRITFIKNNEFANFVRQIEENEEKKNNYFRKPRGRLLTLDIDVAVMAIKKYYFSNKEGEFTRYRSWEYCYKIFQQHWRNPTSKDLLSLHLSWYLASWGMLRGKAFLMNYDYKVHYKVIEQLTSSHFAPLYLEPTNPNLDLVMEAAKIIENGYGSNVPTDTLTTKILLGIFGCAPAYDTNFINAASKYNICGRFFTKKSLSDVWRYYNEHKLILDDLRSELILNGVVYTPMKLMDMALFQIGLSKI